MNDEELTYESIRTAYITYGYLTDKQVEWLMDKVDELQDKVKMLQELNSSIRQ